MYIGFRLLNNAQTYKTLAAHKDEEMQVLHRRVTCLTADLDSLGPHHAQQAVQIQEQASTIGTLKKESARRKKRLVKWQQLAEDAVVAVEDLRTENAGLRAQLDHCRAASRAEICRWKDKCYRLMDDIDELKASFKRKINRLYVVLHRREWCQEAFDTARVARNSDLHCDLAAARSDLSDARASARACQQQASSLSETLDFAAAEHRFHMQTCQQRHAARDRRLRNSIQQRNGLVGSLDFATAEHRLHLQVCQRHRSSGIATQALADENAGLNFTLSTVNRARAAAETRRRQAETARHLQRRHHQLAVRSYRAGQRVSDAQIDHPMEENSGLQSRLSIVSRAYATEEAQRWEAQRQHQDTVRDLEIERERNRLARMSYQAGQRTSDTFVEQLLGVADSPRPSEIGTGDMDLLMDIDLSGTSEGTWDESADEQLDTSPEAQQDSQQVHEDEATSSLDDSDDSRTSSSPSSAGNTTTNTPSFIRTLSFSRSPSASPALMTPGSEVLPRGWVLKKLDVNETSGGTPGSMGRTGIVMMRQLHL